MASSTKDKLSNQALFFEKVLAEFADLFSSPSAEILSTRCISKKLLLKNLINIRDKLAFPGNKRISGTNILLHLERTRIVSPIATFDPKMNEIQDQFYLVGITSNENNVDPIELLQALEPKGVICYFTALEFYGLTTQIPTHHHIAKLVQYAAEPKNKVDYTNIVSSKNRKYDSFGNKKFIFEDIPFYVTKRDEALMPGIQERFLNDRTRFRITTIEQALIDTLHRPLSCGGAAVVFEVWENAVDKVNDNILFKYLSEINNLSLSCRVGYMLQIMNYDIKGDLVSFLDSAKNLIQNDKSKEAVSLLQGIDYQQLNEEWLIKVP